MMSAAAVLAAAASLAIALGVGVMPWQRTEPQLDELVAAVGTTRPVEPRLTGGFNYGPLTATRSGQGLAFSASPDVRIAAAEIDRQTASQMSPEALRARALAALMVGNNDASVFALEQAASQRPDDARVASDLAAAYLARHRLRSDAADLTRALESATRAVEIDPRLAEAQFNRALALERLDRDADARAAWQRYLEIDGASGWADEVRARLRNRPGQP
jgi:tetratricopeptide (TPR) repeat protein